MNKTEHLAHVTDLSVFLVTYIVSKGERPGLLLTTGEFQVKKKNKPGTFNTSQLTKCELAFHYLKRILLCFRTSKSTDEGNLTFFS